MLNDLFFVAVGAVVAWQFPQPVWTAKLVAAFKVWWAVKFPKKSA